MYTYITTGRNERGMVLFEPCPRLAGRAVEHERLVVEEQHAIAEGERQDRPLLGDQHGRTLLASESDSEVEERLRAVRVELRGRLVEQQQFRLERQRRGEAHPLQLPARKLRDEP